MITSKLLDSPVTRRRKVVLKVGLPYSIMLTAYMMGRTVPTIIVLELAAFQG